MCRKPVMTHIRPVNQAAFYHEPSQESLESLRQDRAGLGPRQVVTCNRIDVRLRLRCQLTETGERIPLTMADTDSRSGFTHGTEEILDYVAKVDTYAKVHPSVFRQLSIPNPEFLLDLHSTPNRIHYTTKLS